VMAGYPSTCRLARLSQRTAGFVIAGAGEYLHSNGVAPGDSRGEQPVDALASGRLRVLPRNLRAESSERGSAARARNAKMTASRLVFSR
jgi:hypothetical protein